MLRPRSAIDLPPLLVTDGVTALPSFMTKFVTHFSALAQPLLMPRMTNVMADKMRIPSRPIVPPVEECAVPVIARPVGVHRERDDRNVHVLGIDRQQNAAIMVKKLQIARIDPTAIARPADIAPIVVGNAAVDIHVRTGRDRRYHRKFGRRTGTHVYGVGRKARARHGRGGCTNSHHQGSSRGNKNVFHRFSPFFQKLRMVLKGQRAGTGLCSAGDTWPRHAGAVAKPAKQHKWRITLC
ncbi:MAG TPA: hypothetical protein VFX37_04220 [Pseudolabrys sp.]|nr:hypothetical protein [Pseudolabrys sp.]